MSFDSTWRFSPNTPVSLCLVMFVCGMVLDEPRTRPIIDHPTPSSSSPSLSTYRLTECYFSATKVHFQLYWNSTSLYMKIFYFLCSLSSIIAPVYFTLWTQRHWNPNF